MRVFSSTVSQNTVVQEAVIEQNIKIKDPWPFDGNRHSEMRGWIFSVKLLFNSHSNTYNTDVKKVASAMLFLEGPAWDHFQALLTHIDDPDWKSNFDLFLKELKTHFGVPDEASKAE